MTPLQRRFMLAVAALLVLGIASQAGAWGPVTHIKLASDILANLWLLPASVAALVARHRRFFIYGNIATDTVLAKKMSKTKQVCHQWSTGLSLLRNAQTDAGRAFACGYLCHLAADTVAHNKYLPRQMAISRSTISFGHLYWELRADALIPRSHWLGLRHVVRGTYHEPERLLESFLRETLLSYRTNRFIFRRMNLLTSERAWRRSVQFWSRLSRFTLEPGVLTDYHEESVARAADVLGRGDASAVLHEDPNGNSSLAYARAQRRQLRQLRRAGVPHAHVIHEAAAGHAPAGGARRLLSPQAAERVSSRE